MLKFQRSVKVGNTEAYLFNVGKWSNGEEILTFEPTSEDGNVSIVSSSFDEATLSFLATGAAVGAAVVNIAFTTATRTNCVDVQIKVEEGC